MGLGVGIEKAIQRSLTLSVLWILILISIGGLRVDLLYIYRKPGAE